MTYPAPVFPAPAAVTAEEVVFLDGAHYKCGIEVGVTDGGPPPPGALVEYEFLRTKDGGDGWQPLAIHDARTAAMPPGEVEVGREYQFRARLVAADGVGESDWTASPLLLAEGCAPRPTYAGLLNYVNVLRDSGELRFVFNRPADPAFAGFVLYERSGTPHEGSFWIEFARTTDNELRWQIPSTERVRTWPEFSRHPERFNHWLREYPEFTLAIAGVNTAGKVSEPVRFVHPPLNPPAPPTVRAQWTDDGALLRWDDPDGFGDFDVSKYEVLSFTTGADPAAGQRHVLSGEKRRLLLARSFHDMHRVRAIDVNGRSSDWMEVAIPIVPVPAPEVITDVAGAAVMFNYRLPADHHLAIAEWELRRGADFATAEIVAREAGQSRHTIRVEKVGGVYNYWLTATDVAGQVSPPVSATANVKFNSDILAHWSARATGFAGLKSHAVKIDGNLYLPIQPHTWREHFTIGATSRHTVQDYIDHGFRYLAQPTGRQNTADIGKYRQDFDYGEILTDAIVQIRPFIKHLGGFPPDAQGNRPAPTIIIEHSTDGAAWTRATFNHCGLLSNFRHLRVELTMPRSNEKSLAELEDLLVILIRPHHTLLTGTATATNAPAGDEVTLTPPPGHTIIAIEPPLITPTSPTPLLATTTITTRALNPASFRVKLYTPTATRTAANFHWQAQAVLLNTT